MSRAVIVLNSPRDRQLAHHWIDKARHGSRVEFKGPQRSLDQNARFWAMASDMARQCRIDGKKYSVTQWKFMVLDAAARERDEKPEYLPSLNGGPFVRLDRSSSDLSVAEMTQVIEWMYAYGAENGILWSDPTLEEERAVAS